MYKPSTLAIGLLLSTSLLLAGCASGPKYADVAQSIPTLQADKGRIYFLRGSSIFGSAMQPELRLNQEVVGKSQPGGFFYIDRPAGQYVVSASTETEKTLNFTLATGETKYVRSAPSLGVIVGRITLTLETPDAAQQELRDLSYTGAPAAKK